MHPAKLIALVLWALMILSLAALLPNLFGSFGVLPFGVIFIVGVAAIESVRIERKKTDDASPEA